MAVRLRVNKNHLQGNFHKERRKSLMHVGALVLCASLYTGLIGGITGHILNLEQVSCVTEDVRESMYMNNIYFPNVYGLLDTPEVVDHNDPLITKKALDCMAKLEVDALKTNDFSFLRNCSHLTELVISNAEYLTDDALLEIAKVPNLDLTLFYNSRVLKKDLRCKQNLACLEGLTVHICSQEDITDEIDAFSMYLYFKDVNPSWVSFADYEKMKRIDQKLEALISTVCFDDVLSEEDILLKLVTLIGQYIVYDPYVSDHLDYEKGDLAELIVKNYNRDKLSFMLGNDKNEIKGICCNYAALLSAMCQKLGIESYYVIGTSNVTNRGHAWNLVFINGNWYYVDVTKMDTTNTIDSFLNDLDGYKVRNSKRFKVVVDRLKEDTFMFATETNYGNYDIYTDVDDLMTPEVPLMDVTYVNESIEGKLVQNRKNDSMAVILCGSSLLGATVGMVYGNKILEDSPARVLKKKEDVLGVE